MAEFRVLGAVEAYTGGRLVDTGAPRQRTVLAALLVDTGTSVPTDTLVDRVWGEDPPPQARRSLHSYLARLRRLLAEISTPGTPAALVRRAGGYALEVAPEQVDLHRFRALVDRARTVPDRERVALLREALGLWRGEPLAGTSGDWAERLRGRLHQQRQAAAVVWAGAELRLGNGAALVEPLADLVNDYPLVEPLAAAYLLALRAAGRSADALRHYATLRERLADALGVSPTAELQQAYQEVLREEPAAAPASRSVPAMLPPDVHGFTGRADQLVALDAILDSGADQPSAVVITTLSGTAGIGKTALAVHWAHRVRDRYPDGQLYLNLRGFDPAGPVVQPAQAVRTFLDALGVPADRVPADHDAQVGLYRSQLAGRRVLVVLDNARDAAQVRPLLPGSPTTTVLITSRNRLTSLVVAEGAHPVTVDLLSPLESRALLARRLGSARLAKEPAAVREIIARCARLPLALAIAAARAAVDPRLSLAAVAADLAAARDTLDALAGEDPTTDARAVFSWSYRALSGPAARLFGRLGLHPGPDISLAAAASLAGLPSGRTHALLAELSDAHLVTEHSRGRYAMHDLLRAYAREQAAREQAGDGGPAIRRLLDHYLRSAEAAALLINPHREQSALGAADPEVTLEAVADPAGALAWFTAERAGLVAAVALAASAGFDPYAWQLARSLITFLDGQGHWLDAIATQRIAIEAATRLDDQQALARAHRLLALTHLRLGSYDDAYAELQHARELCAALGDLLGQARCEDQLSALHGQQGNHAGALAHAHRALALFREAGHAAGQAVVLNAIGWQHAMVGDHELALSHCEQALAIQQEIGDRVGAADTWDSIGYAQHQLGRYPAAIEAYEQALALYREFGDRNLEAETLIRLGDTYEATGDLSVASRTWHRAAAIYDELDRPANRQLRARLDRVGSTVPRSNGETTWVP